MKHTHHPTPSRGRSCPPCDGGCRQGRDCPSKSDPEPFSQRDALWVLLGWVGLPVALWAIFALACFGALVLWKGASC